MLSKFKLHGIQKKANFIAQQNPKALKSVNNYELEALQCRISESREHPVIRY